MIITKIANLLVLFLLLFYASVKDSDAATIYSASVSYSDVSTAVSAAYPGDTIIVPAGSATWNESLVITIPLTLQGQGAGNTIITGNFSSTTRAVIEYDPPGAEDGHFRVTGFNLNGNNVCVPIALLAPLSTSSVVSNVRVDHNTLIGITSSTGTSVYVTGNLFGVVDHNTMYGKVSVESGCQYEAFDNLPYVFGTADNLYFEDNTITHVGNNMFTSGHGSRYASRYNTLINSTTGVNAFDVHGNMNGKTATNMIFEGYGNSIDNSGYGSRLAYVHGGKNLIFYNKLIDDLTVNIVVLEFFNDGLTYYCSGCSTSGATLKMGCPAFSSDGANTMKVRVVSGTGLGQEKTITAITRDTVATMDSEFSTPINSSSILFAYYYTGDKSEAGRVQIVNNSYFWNNRLSNGDLITADIQGDNFFNCDAPCVDVENSPAKLVEDTSFWQDDAAFDGSSGCGCGTLAAMNVIIPTAAGVGYWATDQSCSDLTGLIGVGHTNNIAGTLYRSESDGYGGYKWVQYYTPYTYPHPLTKPAAPQNLRISP